MSIERDYGIISFICDECGYLYDTGTRDWPDALDYFKDDGGRIVNVDGEWEHLCSECAS